MGYAVSRTSHKILLRLPAATTASRGACLSGPLKCIPQRPITGLLPAKSPDQEASSMKKSFATACGGLLIVALAAGCATTQAPSAARSPARSAASSPSVSRPATAAPDGIMQPPGGPVPAGFRAASVTFVSTREAFVLGTAPCRHTPCTSISRTLDRGVSWRGLPAPGVPLSEPNASTGPAVWGIRFATPGHGFVFGNGLWVTTDGGEHWPAAPYPGGAMLSLEIID